MFPLDISYLRPNLGDDQRLYWRYLSYMSKVLAIEPADLILYHQMAEAAGAVAVDASPQGNDGAYDGVTLGETGIIAGNTCPLFDTSYNAPWSAGLAADFNGEEGTFAIWAKVLNAGIWTNGTKEQVAAISADTTENYIQIVTSTVSNRIDFSYSANNTQLTRSVVGLSTIDWFHIALTWSLTDDKLIAYVDGVQQGAVITGLGTWVGSLINNNTVFGTLRIAAATSYWKGWLDQALIWKKALTPAQTLSLATV